MQYPIIGITCNTVLTTSGSFLGVETCSVKYDYVAAIEKAGGVAVLLPIVVKNRICRQLQHLDGLLLTGGYDVSSLLYHEEAQPDQGLLDPRRDLYEIATIQAAYEMNIPILGICRGIQILNVAFGGTLYQNIPKFKVQGIQHMQQSMTRDVASHTVEVIKNTKLYKIWNQASITTNSFHHQAVKKVAPNFLVNAVAKDSIIEGIEDPSKDFVVAVQFHPESIQDTKNTNLFKSFIRAARRMCYQ
jgi:putative glutamine amidotransferase